MPLRAALLGTAVAVPAATLAPNAVRVRGGRRRLRRDARRHRRGDQHAGRRPRARVRPADPAVVPRRLDRGRPARRRAHARHRGPRPAAGRRSWRSCPLVALRRAVPPPRARRRPVGRRARCRGAVATDPAGRCGPRALLHGRHGRVHVGTDLPRPRGRRPVGPGRPGDVPLPAGERARPARRRRPRTPPRRGPRPARGRAGGLRGPGGRRVRADLAGRRGRLPRARRGRGGRGAAELLGRRADRGRRQPSTPPSVAPGWTR